MSIASEALSVTVIGLLVVFAGLLILIFCIKLMALAFQERKEVPQAKSAPAVAPAPVAAPAPVVEAGIEPQVIAAIAAAIAAFDGGNKSLVVRSIRRASGWNKAARTEQIYRF